MAKDQTKRLSAEKLDSDITASDALKNVTDYAPINQQYSATRIIDLRQAMMAAQATETQADAALRSARDNAVAAEWAFHNAVLGCKDQVKAQFGKDSNELQSLGLKKTSEYKRPIAKAKR